MACFKLQHYPKPELKIISPKKVLTSEKSDLNLRSSYLYGFNGQEKDNEVKGAGNHLSFGDMGYDPRLVRRLNIDPATKKYPHLSPYAAFENNPIYFKDPTGEDAAVTISGNTITVSTTIYIYGSGAIQEVANQMQMDIMNVWGSNGNGGKDWTYKDPETGQTYNVKFDIKVELYEGREKNDPIVIPESWNPSNTDNFIEVGATLDDVDRSFVVGGDEGEWRGTGRGGSTLAQDDPAPHELGHILGLKDRYTDDNGADKGWETNIMGDSYSGKVDQRNINGVVEDAVKEYNSSDIKKDNDKYENVKQDFKTKIDKVDADK
jgi:RHS repeat-associated protein